MKTFKEFLQEQAEPLRREAASRRVRIDAWAESVGHLLDQMVEWLKDSDPEGLLSIEKRPMGSDENGDYTPYSHRFPKLTISLSDRVVHVTPIISEVIGPGMDWSLVKGVRGRVDLTNGSSSFMLYCFTAPEESWTITDDRTFETRPFSREAFEAALVSLLG